MILYVDVCLCWCIFITIQHSSTMWEFCSLETSVIVEWPERSMWCFRRCLANAEFKWGAVGTTWTMQNQQGSTKTCWLMIASGVIQLYYVVLSDIDLGEDAANPRLDATVLRSNHSVFALLKGWSLITSGEMMVIWWFRWWFPMAFGSFWPTWPHGE